MNPDNVNDLTRIEIPGWPTVGVGDNGIDMLQCNIEVENMIEAAHMAMRIAAIVPHTKKQDEDAIY